MKDKLAKLIKSFKLDPMKLLSLLWELQKLAGVLRLNNAEKARRIEMATGYIAGAHQLRALADDARYTDFRVELAGDTGWNADELRLLASYLQGSAVSLFEV